MLAGTAYLVWLIYCLTVEVIWPFISKAFFLIQKRSVKLNYTSDQWLKHYICFLWGGQAECMPCSQLLVPSSSWPFHPYSPTRGGGGKLGWERNGDGGVAGGRETWVRWERENRESGREKEGEREGEGERKVPYSSCHVTGDLCPPFKSFPS